MVASLRHGGHSPCSRLLAAAHLCRGNTAQFPPPQTHHCVCPPPPCLCTCWSLFLGCLLPFLHPHFPPTPKTITIFIVQSLTCESLPLGSLFFLSLFLTTPQGMQDFNSLTRDWTPAPCSGSVGPAGNPKEVFSYPWVTCRADRHLGTISEFLIIPYCN